MLDGVRGGRVDGWTDKQAQTLGITMHSCTSYVPDKLNIYDHFII